MTDSISTDIAVTGPPCFDAELEAFVITRYDDVLAALRDGRLSAESSRGDTDPAPTDDGAHAQLRKAALDLFSPERLESWRAQIEPLARDLTSGLRAGQCVDLASDFAMPWALSLAAAVTGVSPHDAAALSHLAQVRHD